MATSEGLEMASTLTSAIQGDELEVDIGAPPSAHTRERDAVIKIDPEGFFIRHPPKAHILDQFETAEDLLFQTIHMGAAVVESEKWFLVIDGLVERPFTLSLSQLRRLPQKSVTSFHECYGSPVAPPENNVWRIGNVIWTGTSLSTILSLARPLQNAKYVWSDGLDHGTFHGVFSDRYQKDLPMEKATAPEVLVAYEMNGKPLGKERGGPVRLVVPGWFGTNSTKWLCKLSLQEHRATGPYTTTFYNEIDPGDPTGQRKRPVWNVEVNSVTVRPVPGSTVTGPSVRAWGWAWCHEPVTEVDVSIDAGETWVTTTVSRRIDMSWQKWEVEVHLTSTGEHCIWSRARTASGAMQPMSKRRNHVHKVQFSVEMPEP
ncbi:Sulfite oxidase [Paramyrothecium foliicola]|nr:Sulfite oxidase [Paramyrothecium foliicola]